ncbi:hypothetical protein JTE90_016371 [Oedothorax gibbosus]|uniref:Pericentrin/AKAP-450 centrosomal targeting domain-containing protein n=1 Tax=Oedothorax gibbosus TaxID=931172 RepID=A0AAV6U9L6_9ARAC|nr:hypothetical protein JTE90_016371 [Oedothorax gibbosus]
MDDEKRKKVEEGRTILEKLRNKKRKKVTGVGNKNDTNNKAPISTQVVDDPVLDEGSESLVTSSIESLCTQNMSVTVTNNNNDMESDLFTELESCRTANRHLEGIIKQLTERLASVMKTSETTDSSRNQEFTSMKLEINNLHLQIKKTKELLEKQKSESREFQNASGEGNHILSKDTEAIMLEASVQVEPTEIYQNESLVEVLAKYSDQPEFTQKLGTFLVQSTSERELIQIVKSLNVNDLDKNNTGVRCDESLDEVLLQYSKSPEFALKLGAFLKQNTTESELDTILNHLNPTKDNKVFDTLDTLDEVLLKYSRFPEFSQKLSLFLKNNTSETELKNITKALHCPEQPELAINTTSSVTVPPTLETPNLQKRIEILSVITKLIESLASVSMRTINESQDFSCSKFQRMFLKRLNSNEAEPDVSEAEGSINYAEVMESPDVQEMHAGIPNNISTVEKLRSSVIAEDFNLVTDFLVDEMTKLSAACLDVGAQGDIMADSLETEELPAMVDSDHQLLLLQKSKLESRIQILKKMDQKSLNSQRNIRHMSIESDTLTNYEDNLLLEEPPLSCVSLLSLTDSEYKTDSVMTDSEFNSRKVSLDIMRSPQEGDFCTKCDRFYELVREKYDDHMCIFKDTLENIHNIEKAEAVKNLGLEIERLKMDLDHSLENAEALKSLELEIDRLKAEKKGIKDSLQNANIAKAEAVKKLDSEIERLKAEIEDFNAKTSQQIEKLLEEQELRIQHLKQEFEKQTRDSESRWVFEKDGLTSELKNLESSTVKLNEKLQSVVVEREALVEELKSLKSENSKSLALEQDRVEEHLQEIEKLNVELVECKNSIQNLANEKESLIEELKALNIAIDNRIAEETSKIESQYISTFELLKKLHEDEIADMKSSFSKQLEEQKVSLKTEHSKNLSLLESSHLSESATLQKKIEQLLEEKCELLSKTTQEYEAILKKNHKALLMLCDHLRKKLNIQKERIFNDSQKSGSPVLETSFSDVLEDLNRSIEYGIVKFLNQNYFLTSENEDNFDDTEYLPIELGLPVSNTDVPSIKDNEQLQNCNVPEAEREMSKSLTQLSEGSIESEDILLIRNEMNKLQEEFQKDVEMYQEINAKLQEEIISLRKQAQELEDHKKKLETQLQEKENQLSTKESELAVMDAGSNDAAQTNSRLLHVLSDLVKTFLDIEHDINSHLVEHGLTPSRSGTFTHNDEERGHIAGSREDFASLSIGECPNIELVEDGPDLTPRTWDLFSAAGAYDTELEGEDVVLGASRRLKQAVDHVLNLLTRALNNQQNQDLKYLLKRNEELSQELQEESLGRDNVAMELLNAESNIRRLEGEKQRLEDNIRDLKENEEELKREIRQEKNKVGQLAHEKELACDEIQMLKGQCEMLASRLGDPEKTGIPKMSDSSDTCASEQAELLQENSKLSTEKQSVQKSLSKERETFLSRLHQMELALEELNAEKDSAVEQKVREIVELRAEMDAMEKQLNSNKKFIDEQAQEREQERDEYIREMNKMQDIVREKEKIQSNEAQLTKEIDSLEQLLRTRIEDHQSTIKKKEAVENELRQSVDKNKDLRDIIEELETQLDKKSKIENELRQKMVNLNESIDVHEKIHIAMGEESNKPRNIPMNGVSIEQMENLREQLASQSQQIEQMQQNQTLLHELRGQIHFLEAKVEQRAKLLESSLQTTSPSQSDTDISSPCGSQGSPLQMPCDDGYEMSPRSIHWLEIRRLEEKIGRLAHVDEELVRRNRELEAQAKKLKAQLNELQHENAALQERLSEELVQISVLRSHMEEEKHRGCSTPQKSTLQAALQKEVENNKGLVAEMQEMQEDLYVFREEIREKENMIEVLQNKLHAYEETKLKHPEHDDKHASTPANDSDDRPACFKLMLLEKEEEVISKNQEIELLKRELEELRKIQADSSGEELEKSSKISAELEKENNKLKLEVESLNKELEQLNEQLTKTKEQVEIEQAQVETLCEEMANLSQNSIDDSIPHTPSSDNSKALEHEILTLKRRLSISESQLREKSLEASMLSASKTKLQVSLRASEKELELEQVQVETLLQELGSLTGYQKRLEQDFNTVQEMMLQKERELATLHEETDAQMRLEAELEALSKEVEDQKAIEEELKVIMKQMEMNFEGSKRNLELQIDQWKAKFGDSEKSHHAEVTDLRRRIKILSKKKSSKGQEDIDISEVQRQILEASSAFGTDDSEGYGNLVYDLVKRAVDTKINQMAKKHEDSINDINETWETKIKSELNNNNQFRKRCEKLEKENLLLREKFAEHSQRLSLEKDTHWQAKLKDIENSAKLELKTKYENEIANLKLSLDNASKERSSAEAKSSTLSRQVKDLKKKFQGQKNEMVKEFENKLSLLEKELKDRRDAEMAHRQEIERLREDFQSQLQREKNLEERHREEVANLHKFFEAKGVDEMKKFQVAQMEEFRKLKDTKEKNIEALCNHLFTQYEERFKAIQEEYAKKLAEEQAKTDQRHNSELRELQLSLEVRFEKEKKQILEERDKEIKKISESFEKKLAKKILELRRSASSSEEQLQSRTEEAHRKEVENLRRDLEAKFRVEEGKRKSLELAYLRQVEKVNEMMRDTSNNRTATPSSEMTSSDDACSSCQEDMLPGNKHLLVNKIHQDGKRVLQLIESCQVPSSTEKEARLWLEERKWIVNKITNITPEIIENQANLKLVISNLVEELLNARQRLILSYEEINGTKERFSELERQLDYERSKVSVLANNLSRQHQLFRQYESQLDSKSDEVIQLKKILANENRLSHLNSTEKSSQRVSENLTMSYDVGCLRSADDPRSAERFSAFSPELGNPSPFKITEVEAPVHLTPQLHFQNETDCPDAPTTPDNVFYESKKDVSNLEEELMNRLSDAKNNQSDYAKLHCLYLVYMRSLSYNKSLVYQKQYLIQLLRGFQSTETATLAWLSHLNNRLPHVVENDSSVVETRLRGRSRFRSVGFLVVAIIRIKYLVKRWGLRALIPSNNRVDAEIRRVFRCHSTPTNTPGSHHLSSISLSTSIGRGETTNHGQIITNSRSDSKNSKKNATTDSSLVNCVQRLKLLQKQLGLEQNFR